MFARWIKNDAKQHDQGPALGDIYEINGYYVIEYISCHVLWLCEWLNKRVYRYIFIWININKFKLIHTIDIILYIIYSGLCNVCSLIVRNLWNDTIDITFAAFDLCFQRWNWCLCRICDDEGLGMWY